MGSSNNSGFGSFNNNSVAFNPNGSANFIPNNIGPAGGDHQSNSYGNFVPTTSGKPTSGGFMMMPLPSGSGSNNPFQNSSNQ